MRAIVRRPNAHNAEGGSARLLRKPSEPESNAR
ncbi:hypothetical protein CLV63_11455 [Murinocardiopsis flavida]|uniref:Uncharacterized protein n=1 Tax=Murinocardiopsis flavida TaxID=645275 RepID=A0A2P8DEI4_9ACTN|nr:hypothetical protein CLV63_11455 [Murinocardiopsis flavida]